MTLAAYHTHVSFKSKLSLLSISTLEKGFFSFRVVVRTQHTECLSSLQQLAGHSKNSARNNQRLLCVHTLTHAQTNVQVASAAGPVLFFCFFPPRRTQTPTQQQNRLPKKATQRSLKQTTWFIKTNKNDLILTNSV